VHRLDRLVARNTGASRKTVTRWCKSGSLTDHEGVALRPADKVAPANLPMEVLLDGEPLVLRDELHVLLHKPVGVITAMKDGLHPTAFSLVNHHPLSSELRAVGRLDLDCSGLLLWTTHGPLVHKLTHPKYKIQRTYEVALARPTTRAEPPDLLEDGTTPHVVRWNPVNASDCHPALARPDQAVCYARICLDGGAYHEVKRIFAAMGSHVLALARTRHAHIELPRDLPAGESTVLSRDELERAFAQSNDDGPRT
jgi:16S rRNA pseudouridine516 synthase